MLWFMMWLKLIRLTDRLRPKQTGSSTGAAGPAIHLPRAPRLFPRGLCSTVEDATHPRCWLLQLRCVFENHRSKGNQLIPFFKWINISIAHFIKFKWAEIINAEVVTTPFIHFTQRDHCRSRGGKTDDCILFRLYENEIIHPPPPPPPPCIFSFRSFASPPPLWRWAALS